MFGDFWRYDILCSQRFEVHFPFQKKNINLIFEFQSYNGKL